MNTWQKRRIEFNHDWMKNIYLISMDAFIGRIHDLKETTRVNGRVEEFIKIRFFEWELHKKEAEWLINNFKNQMSPKECLNSGFLKYYSEDDKKWMGELIHELWLIRHPVDEWIKNSHKAFNKVEKLYRDIKVQLSKHKHFNATYLLSMKTVFENFCEACSKFSETISQLPNKYLVS